MAKPASESKWKTRRARGAESRVTGRQAKLRAPSSASAPSAPLVATPAAPKIAQPKIVAAKIVAAKPKPARDHRVPVAEMDDLHVKTIQVIGGSGIGRMEISRRGGPVPSTLSNWENHRVKRPALSTVRAALRACGYSLAILDPDGQKL